MSTTKPKLTYTERVLYTPPRLRLGAREIVGVIPTRRPPRRKGGAT